VITYDSELGRYISNSFVFAGNNLALGIATSHGKIQKGIEIKIKRAE